jgi:AraC family transcriptional regulator of adaptative response/methylated-DNA-[protein]-cysteine methyltransferase
MGGHDVDSSSIGYSIFACDMGHLLVAATERGVCVVRFGDEPEALAEALRDEFPFAEVRPDAERLASWVEALRDYLDGRSARLDFPMDVRASQFQRRVWDALRAIPYGATRSYSEIAAAIHRPEAARAVARACASNPVALVVPCHRVIGANGNLSGYRWGAHRKQTLLDRESRRAARTGQTASDEPVAANRRGRGRATSRSEVKRRPPSISARQAIPPG